MSVAVRTMRVVLLALMLIFAVTLAMTAVSAVDARPALADDGGDDDRGDDDDDDGRGGDDDDDRTVPVGGVQTGAGGMSAGGGLTPWLLGGLGLVAGVGTLMSRLRSLRGGADV